MLDATKNALIAMTPLRGEILPPASAHMPAQGFFSTVARQPYAWRPEENLALWLQRMTPSVFQRTHKDVQSVAVSVGMDSAIEVTPVRFAMDDNSLKDAYVLNSGMPMPDVQITWYAAQSFIGYQMCAVLLQHWFIDQACTMPPRDAIRNGYDVARSDGEKLPPKVVDEFKKLDKRFKAKWNCAEAVRKCRAFGIRVILFEVASTDPDYYLKPFNPDGVTPGSYKGMSQVDPYWITPELDFNASANPASKHFYEPTYWRINGKRYHRSHLVVLKTCEVPDVLKPTYFYGGIPLPQRIYERVYAAERTTNEGPQLALTKRTTVVEGVDMAAAAANQAEFQKRIQDWAYMRDNYGVRLSGGTEKVAQFDTALADVDTVIMTQWQIACAIAQVPATKMLGVQPKGFNATGESEEANYHESLESIQEHDMAPILDRHHLLCVRSYICPKFKCEPFETHVEFADLDAETAKEKAERELAESNADKNWSDTGAVDGIDVRNKLINRKGGSYYGIEEAMPEGPRPDTVVDPDAPKTAPNTPPSQQPAGAPPAQQPGQKQPMNPAAAKAMDAALAVIAGAMAGG